MFNTDFRRARPIGATPPPYGQKNSHPAIGTGTGTVGAAELTTDNRLAGLPSRAPTTSSQSQGKGWKERLLGIFTTNYTPVPASEPEPALPVAGGQTPRAPRHPPRHADALQARIDKLLEEPKGLKAAADIGALFGKLGECRNADALAFALYPLLYRLIDMETMPRNMFIDFVPRLVETLLDLGCIDDEHEPVARQAAARVSAYATISTRQGEGKRGTPSTQSAYSPFVGRVLATAVNPAWLQRKLEDPAQWPDLIYTPHYTGPLPESGFRKIQTELLAMCDDMESSAYLQPGLCALLRERAPDIVQARQDLDLRHTGGADNSLLFRIVG